MRRGALALAVVGAALVLYASWAEDSRMGEIAWIPRWISEWADDDRENTRTAVPFVLLGLIHSLWPHRRVGAWRGWLLAFGGLLALIGLAELGQFGIPLRTPCWADIGWGAAGAASGLAGGWVARAGWAKLRAKSLGAEDESSN